jgi:FkbM family methyltransferase
VSITRDLAASRDVPAGVDPGLVFDVGMHRGEDTAHYLTRGFRVVGVEPNPTLVRRLRQRFAAEVRSGQVTIVPYALGAERGTTPLGVPRDEHMTVLGTASTSHLARARRQGIEMDLVDVEVITLADLLGDFGTPWFVKIDIEGLDTEVVRTLRHVAARPPRLSMETVTTGPNASLRGVVGEVRLLRELGYRRFKLVDQCRLAELDGAVLQAEGLPVAYKYERNASGPFGDDAPGVWRTAPAVGIEMLGRLARHQLVSPIGRIARTPFGSRARSAVRRTVKNVAPAATIHHSWFDLHAAL